MLNFKAFEELDNHLIPDYKIFTQLLELTRIHTQILSEQYVLQHYATTILNHKFRYNAGIQHFIKT